jgi:hypothetical protein
MEAGKPRQIDQGGDPRRCNTLVAAKAGQECSSMVTINWRFPPRNWCTATMPRR